MKVLVTGGAGFIGSHIVDRFVAAGHRVVVVDDLSTGRLENLHKQAKFCKGDISNMVEMQHVFEAERPDVVSHQAAQADVRRSVQDPLMDARINILGSLNLLELAARFQVKKFILASTGGAIYGEPAKLPAEETSALRPISHYAAAKLAAETYLHVYESLYGLRTTALRYANVYGPGQNPEGEAGVVAIFARQMLRGETPKIYGDGSKTRDYVFVDDIAEANLAALKRADGKILNLGCGRQITDYQVFEAVRRSTGFQGDAQFAARRPGEIEHIALDAGRARTVLAWEPRVPFEEGIARTVEHIRRQLRVENAHPASSGISS